MKIHHSILLSAAALGLVLTANSASGALLAHYSFDSDYTDSSGNARHGTLTDVGTLGNSGITTTVGEFQFGGGALNLSSDSDYVALSLANTITLSASAVNGWTVAFWAKNQSVANNSGGMILGDTSDTRDFIWVDQGTATGGGVRFRNTANANANFGGMAEDTAWHHYVLVYSDADSDTTVDDVTLYRDGAFSSTVNNFAGNLTINGIGQAYNSDAYDFDGQLDEIYIFDEAITGTQANSLFTTNAIPEPSSALLVCLGLLTPLLRRRR